MDHADEVLPMVTELVPLLVLVLVGWLVARAITGRDRAGDDAPPIDAAVVVRRLFLLGLLYVTMVVAAQGLVELFSEVSLHLH